MNFINIIIFSFISFQAWGLSPSPLLEEQDKIGRVQNFQDPTRKVDVAKMSSEFEYEDLKSVHTNEILDYIETKKEFGKLFGIREWEIKKQELTEAPHGRIFIIEGTYIDSHDDKVNFLEVYWANKKESRQYLITSELRQLKIDDYKEFLIP